MAKAKENFVIYIDESGDEGFKFVGPNRSSQWFVLAAAVIRKENDLDLVSLLREYRQEIRKPRDSTIHFRNLNHTQRIPYVHRIAAAKIRTITVLCHKQSLTETEYLLEKHRLYFYLCRYLFERASWLCKDKRPAWDYRSARAQIVFSNRSGMSYDDMRDYLTQLRLQSQTTMDIKVDWHAISPNHLTALPHRLRAGLQVADAIATSYFYAFEPSAFGYTEDRYAKALSPVAFKHKKSGSLHGFGVKVFPKEALEQVRTSRAYDWIPGIPIKEAGPGPEDPTH